MTKHPANEYLSPEEDAELKFNDWFYNDLYGRFTFRFEYFEDDIKIEDENQRKKILIGWLESAFLSGWEYAKMKEQTGLTDNE